MKESEQDKFYKDKAELDKLLLEYLGHEQEKVSIQNKEEISEEFARSLRTFYSGLSEVGRDSIISICNTYRDEEFQY